MNRILLSLAVTALITGAAMAQNAPTKKAEPAKKAEATKIANATKDGKAICPIMKDEFPIRPTSTRSTYKGKTYVFCCDGCKPEFDKTPAKYVTEAKPAAKAEKTKKKS